MCPVLKGKILFTFLCGKEKCFFSTQAIFRVGAKVSLRRLWGIGASAGLINTIYFFLPNGSLLYYMPILATTTLMVKYAI